MIQFYWFIMNNQQNQILVDQIQPNYDNIPLAIFLIGANGSGKSTLRNYLNLTDIQTNIDPDVLNRLYKDRYPKTYQTEAAIQALDMYNYAINNQLNFCIESILSEHGSIGMIEKAKTKGYYIIGYFVALNDINLNLERIKNRVKIGGHDIASELVRKRYSESFDRFN